MLLIQFTIYGKTKKTQYVKFDIDFLSTEVFEFEIDIYECLVATPTQVTFPLFFNLRKSSG